MSGRQVDAAAAYAAATMARGTGDSVLAALAHPVRREILQRCATPTSPKDIADQL